MHAQQLRSRGKRFVKHLAIKAGLEAIALSNAGRIFPKVAGRGVIFTLHHVRPPRPFAFEPNALLSVTPEFLEEAIVVARGRGLHPVHLDELPSLLADPADKRRFMCFTLDDGYRDNALYAAPVFRRRAVPYTVFITEGFVERSRSIWWETAEALVRARLSFVFDFGTGTGPETVPAATRNEKFLAFERLAAVVGTMAEDDAVMRIDHAAREAGIDPLAIVAEEVMDARELGELAADGLCRLGAHTLTHPNLARTGDERLTRELTGSSEAVARYCGRVPTTFAYPYGGRHAVDGRTTQAALRAGYRLAVTTQPGVIGPTSLERPAELPRVSLNGHFQKGRYVEALISGLPFKLPS